jgi:hypothetical protein
MEQAMSDSNQILDSLSREEQERRTRLEAETFYDQQETHKSEQLSKLLDRARNFSTPIIGRLPPEGVRFDGHLWDLNSVKLAPLEDPGWGQWQGQRTKNVKMGKPDSFSDKPSG